MIKVKRFELPTFEEWEQANRCVKLELGAYRVEIRGCIASAGRTLYQLLLTHVNTCGSCTKRLYGKAFVYNDNDDKLKQWYNHTVSEFHEFWKNYMKATYLEVE